MKFYLSDLNEYKEATVKVWNGTGYGPDCFCDLEVNFPLDHKKEEGGDAYICTSFEYNNLINWWSDEISAMNNGAQANDVDYSDCPNPDIYLFFD